MNPEKSQEELAAEAQQWNEREQMHRDAAESENQEPKIEDPTRVAIRKIKETLWTLKDNLYGIDALNLDELTDQERETIIKIAEDFKNLERSLQEIVDKNLEK